MEKEQPIMNFKEARNATEQIFSNPEISNDNYVEEPTAEDNNVQNEAIVDENQSQVSPEDVGITEKAVSTAEQTLAMLQQERQANEQLRQRLSELESMSNQQSEQVVAAEEARAMTDEIPILDISDMAFDDDETIQQKQAEYTQKMLEYSQRQIMRELEPYIAQAREGLIAKEREQTLAELSSIPQLSGIGENIGAVENIINNNPIFVNTPDMSMKDKYINAYILLKGINNVNTPQKSGPTNDDFMKMYQNSPELQEMIEKERISKLNSNNGNAVPVFSASSGAANAALNIKETPKNFEEASKVARSFFWNN